MTFIIALLLSVAVALFATGGLVSNGLGFFVFCFALLAILDEIDAEAAKNKSLH